MVMKQPPSMQQLPMQSHQSRGVHAQRLSSPQRPSMQKRLMHHNQRMTQLLPLVLCERGAPQSQWLTRHLLQRWSNLPRFHLPLS
jgi:hypothetical protein